MKVYVRVTDDKNQTYEGITELTKSTKQKSKKHIEIKAQGPTGVIKQFYYQKYFENPRTLKAVETKIKLKKYNFVPATIEMALKRAKFLKREGKRGHYSFIQKGPAS